MHRVLSKPASQATKPVQMRINSIVAAVSELTERLGGTRDWRSMLPEAMRILGIAIGADRILFVDLEHFADGQARCTGSIGWSVDGSELLPAEDDWVRFDLSGDFGRWLRSFQSNRPICSHLVDLPPDERIKLEPRTMKSVLAHPVIVNGEVGAFLRFDFHRSGYEPSSIEIELVGIVARQIATLMLQDRREAGDRHADKMIAMERMAGGVAHDLNNLLTVLGGALELSRLGLESGEPMRGKALKNLEHGDRAIAQTSDLLRRLLEFSQSREGRPETICPGDFISEMTPVLQQIVGRGITVMLNRGSLAAGVRIDPIRMEQMLMCLAVNARDSMPEGGRLRIRITSSGDGEESAGAGAPESGKWVSIFVDDDGTGMSESVEERIFEPFFSTRPAGQGTGLGLVTVHTAVKGAGGRISVDSMPGVGTTFRIDLPAVEPVMSSSQPQGDGFEGKPSAQSELGS